MDMVKSKWALGLVGVLAVSAPSIGAARADETCKNRESSIADLEKKLAEFERRLDQVPTVSLGPIARKSDGWLRRKPHAYATRYCATRGGLPTAKQLALALNPKGVSDIPREGFYEVAPTGEPVFYYNYGTYEPPTSYEGHAMLWSSSIPSNVGGAAFVFDGSHGYIYEHTTFAHRAIRCVGR